MIAVTPIYILAECFCSVVSHREHFFVSVGSYFKNRDGLVGIAERGSEEKLCSPLFSTRRPSSKEIVILYMTRVILDFKSEFINLPFILSFIAKFKLY